jgi:molybdate transport system substrate-binding protein
MSARGLVLALVTLLAGAGPAAAAEVKVFSAGAVKAVVPDIAEAFRKETGHTVTFTFDTAGALRRRVEAGETADVLIATDTVLEALAKQDRIVAGTRADIARTAIGVAVREGTPKPDISSVDAFKRALLEARSIVYNDPAIGATSGIHFAEVLQRLGIADAVKPKTVLWKGGYAAEALLNGQADLCVHQISEILPVKGVVLVGPLPPELQKITTYSATVLAKALSSDAARAFVQYLARADFRPRFATAGLDYR